MPEMTEPESKQLDPVYIIAAMIEAAGGEIEVPRTSLENEYLVGKAIEMEERLDRGTLSFKLVSMEEK